MEDFFNSAEYLEPRCKGCGSKIELDITTRFDEEKQVQVCKDCGESID